MKSYKIITRRQIMAVMAAFAVLTLALITILGSPGGEQLAAANKKLPIYAVNRAEDDKIISISFDATWGNDQTQELIDIMAKYDVKSTFFLVARWVDQFPESVRAIIDGGHELGNHSTTHPHMSKQSKEQMRNEIRTCNDHIEAATGTRPILFRAPYGEYCNELIDVIDEESMYCIQWDVDSIDWKEISAEEMIERVCGKVVPGSIVLFHNGGENTSQALPVIIERLQAQGYRFVPISENICREDFTLDHAGRQTPVNPPAVQIPAAGPEPNPEPGIMNLMDQLAARFKK